MELSDLDLIISQEGGSPPLFITPPETLEELLNTIQSNIDFIPSALLYSRKGIWVKIIDNRTYTSILKKALQSGTEELEMKVQMGAASARFCTEEAKSMVDDSWDLITNESQVLIETENSFSGDFAVYYRRLNGGTDGLNQVKLPELDLKLSELSSRILRIEGVTGEWACAMYTEDGYPLTGTLAQMFYTKISEVLSENSKICVFIVPYFDQRSLEPMDPAQGQTEITLTHSADATISHTIMVDLKMNTVDDLKRKLTGILDIPTYEIRLKNADSFLAQGEKMLDFYGICQDSVIIYFRETSQYNENTYKEALKQSVEQTIEGQRAFHSFLFSFAHNISCSEKPVKEAFLAGIRKASNNCTPLLHALFELSHKKGMSLLNSIALEEGFILLTRAMLNEIFQMGTAVPANKTLEHVIEVVALLCDLFSRPGIESHREETYTEIDIVDPLNFTTITDPVYIKKADGTFAYYDYDSLVTRIDANTDIPGVPQLDKNSLNIHQEFKILIRRCTLNNKAALHVWKGTYDPRPTLLDLARTYFPQGVTWSRCLDLRQAYKLTKVVPPLSLKDPQYKNCLTFNKKKELCINFGLTPKVPNKVDFMNVLDRSTDSMDIDDLASAIELTSVSEESKECITRVPEEAVVVVIDKSGSMGEPFVNDEDFTRLAAVKQFFESFADRTVGYNYQHVMSLLLFSTEITRVCNFTENLSTFTRSVHKSTNYGQTMLWGAISHAVDLLVQFKTQYPNCILRVLCLSDGEDNCSAISHLNLCKKVLANSITVDCVVVGPLSNELKGISFASGGYVFLPNSIQQGIKLFESETFLSVRSRVAFTQPTILCEAHLHQYMNKPFSNALPDMKTPAQINGNMELPVSTIQRAAATPPAFSNQRVGATFKRILRELKSLSDNPHPDIAVYPSTDDSNFWNVYISGPEDTPYQFGLFHIYIRFPQNYPFSAPEVRLITPIYHCNINSNGRICHSVLDQFYSPAVSVRHILDCIYGLFMTPEPMDPLDANIAAEYQDNFSLYESKAKEFTRIHAGRPLAELTRGLSRSQSYPRQYLDPISGVIMRDPVICSKTNETYERSEIMKVIWSTGKDPKTGVSICENDLVPNLALKQTIEEHEKAVSNPWFLK